MIAALTLGVACVGGLAARRLRVPGGALVGALLTTAGLSQLVGEISVPEAVRTVLFIGVGVMIGTVVTRSTVRALRHTVLPAVVSALALVGFGVGVALLLRVLGIAPSGDVLATSPGALSVLTAAAVEGGHDASTVALFHVTRVFLVMLSLPLLTKLLDEFGPGAGSGGQPDRADDHPGSGDERSAEGQRGPRERGFAVLQLLVTAAGATVGGLLLAQTGLGGALVLGSTVAAAAVTLAYSRPRPLPDAPMTAISVGLGWMVGALMTPETVTAMRTAVVPAVLTAVLLVGAGIAIAYLLRASGHGPPGDVLATSPGAMEALAAAAVERDTGPLQVAVFHIVRILLVIVSLPLLLELTR